MNRKFFSENYYPNCFENIFIYYLFGVLLIHISRSQQDCFSREELFSVLFYGITLVSMGMNTFKIISYPAEGELSGELIGYGVYVMQASLEHSCNHPNTEIIVDKGYRILYATRPIKAGEVVSTP